ncbi:formylmethanofuran dehydrogenase subunit A [Candidatus Bathyarchaeota archaeon]|nr:MAG: formylmethanofuran dehydrogenase subunit A [Candidatus Bathyarchaeota archaeon]
MEYLIKNGFVYDPINGIKGEKMDIAVKDGKIVSTTSLSSDAKVVDANGMVVMPGGIDIHSHIAGPKVNAGRIMRPEDHYKVYMRMIPKVRRPGTGKTTPSTNIIGYKYARMGWTTVFEPATPPLETRHTHEELDDIPILDKGCFPLLDSNWFVLDYLQNKEYEKCAAFVGWIMNAMKGYAVKIVDPGVAEAWSRGGGIGLSLDDQIPGYNLTPREIIRGLCRVNSMLKLPHPIHVHCNRLGFPGNYTCTLDTMDAVSDLGLNQDSPIIHITHVQFTGYSGESWTSLGSGGEEIAKYVNNHKHVSLDLGQIVFGDATTMTADAPFEFVLHHLAPGRWTSTDVEAETSAGIVPYRYKKKNFVNTVQWCIGLEVALLVKDPWRIFPTTDHPNAGPFTSYPTVISWLMSKKAREKMFEQINRRGLRRTVLPSLDREYDLYEIAIITRAAGAKILGLPGKGHLGIGADADIAIYNINPEKIDLSKDYETLVKALKRAAYTFKNGEMIVKDGEILRHTYGETYYVKPKIPEDLLKATLEEVGKKFKEWYSISFENYVIGDHELRAIKPVSVKTSLK